MYEPTTSSALRVNWPAIRNAYRYTSAVRKAFWTRDPYPPPPRSADDARDDPRQQKHRTRATDPRTRRRALALVDHILCLTHQERRAALV